MEDAASAPYVRACEGYAHERCIGKRPLPVCAALYSVGFSCPLPLSVPSRSPCAWAWSRSSLSLSPADLLPIAMRHTARLSVASAHVLYRYGATIWCGGRVSFGL